MRFLAQGPKGAGWHMKQNKMTGHLTTQWDQLATVKTGPQARPAILRLAPCQATIG